jgi:hypothetical protein
VPDLHGWITQQIDHTEAIALDATPGPWHVTEYNWQTDFDAGIGTSPGEVDVVGHGYEGGGIEYLRDARHIAVHDPATVLRRCTADGKILEVHKPYGGRGYGGHACTGCGELNEDWAVDHTNDCPTLLALAEGYGLTPEALTTLDRPIPEPYPPVRLSGPRPDTRRVPPALRGPNWKATP